MMKLLSVVIPSYNTELFIDKNMRTFIDQRLFDNVEIILVNDGSKDQTAQKILFYESEYPGFIRAIDKENGGHGSVINVGIDKARGKYIKVVDADDWVDTENMVKLVKDLSDCDADIIINPYYKISQSTGKTSLVGEYKGVNSVEPDKFDSLMKAGYKLALHSITVKTSILKNNHIRMTEKCFYEDFEYTFFPIPYFATVKVLDYPIYYYLVGQKSQSVNASNALKNIKMYMRVMKDSLQYFDENEERLDDTRKEYMTNCLCDYIRSMYNIYLHNKCSKTVYRSMLDSDKELQNMSEFFYDKVGKKNSYISFLRKGGYVVYFFLSGLFRLYKSRTVS